MVEELCWKLVGAGFWYPVEEVSWKLVEEEIGAELWKLLEDWKLLEEGAGTPTEEEENEEEEPEDPEIQN